MRILFVGDVMGRSGREALEKFLPKLRDDLRVDVTIVNGENAAHGRGINRKFCSQFYDMGIDCITTGNHIWDQREVIPYIDSDSKLLRPANFPKAAPGNGLYLHELNNGAKILIVNLMGRLFMDPLDDPFDVMEGILQDYALGPMGSASAKVVCQSIFVDFHGEATSEKMAFAHNFDGRISAVIGTHTHVPTADNHVLPKGCAYMSDAGMTGDYDSVIGIKKEMAIYRFTRKMPGEGFIPANENYTICGALVVTDDNTGKSLSIDPVRLGDTISQAIPDE